MSTPHQELQKIPERCSGGRCLHKPRGPIAAAIRKRQTKAERRHLADRKTQKIDPASSTQSTVSCWNSRRRRKPVSQRRASASTRATVTLRTCARTSSGRRRKSRKFGSFFVSDSLRMRDPRPQKKKNKRQKTMAKIDDLPAMSQFPSSPRELAGKIEAREKRVSTRCGIGKKLACSTGNRRRRLQDLRQDRKPG